MRPYLVVIFHVTEQQVTEVALAEHNNMVKAFPADRTDQTFSISILPRGARRRRSIANAYRSESADKDLTIGPVPVTNEIAGSLFPPACLRDLICDPFCGWMRCDAKPQNMSPAVPHDQQSIEQAKRDCRHDEHIHRSDPVSVIAKECPPALRRRVSSPDHVLGHTRLPRARSAAFLLPTQSNATPIRRSLRQTTRHGRFRLSVWTISLKLSGV